MGGRLLMHDPFRVEGIYFMQSRLHGSVAAPLVAKNFIA